MVVVLPVQFCGVTSRHVSLVLFLFFLSRKTGTTPREEVPLWAILSQYYFVFFFPSKPPRAPAAPVAPLVAAAFPETAF
jgi:hypothetical protein